MTLFFTDPDDRHRRFGPGESDAMIDDTEYPGSESNTTSEILYGLLGVAVVATVVLLVLGYFQIWPFGPGQ